MISSLTDSVRRSRATAWRWARRGLSTSSSAAPLFSLDKSFVSTYEHKSSPFGFNGLGEVVYLRTYSRKISDHEREKWYQTVERVVNGTFSLQKQWLEQTGLPWNEEEEQHLAEDMYERMFSMKFLPPGRGLWAMGSPLTTEKKLFAALNNCAFVSTADLLGICADSKSSAPSSCDPAAPFCFLMDASMLGVGVGFDTLGAGSLDVQHPGHHNTHDADASATFVVQDSREGWVDSVRVLLNVYLHPHHSHRRPLPVFDYSLVRAAGEPIKGFGGTSQGPEPLRELHASLSKVLGRNAGAPLSVTTIVDVMNLIGKCIVAGNVRRTAEIAFGDPDSDEYVQLKNYDMNPERQDHGWTSNNSVFARLGMDYSRVCEEVRVNGEPGFAWLQNMQAFSHMNGMPDYKDARAQGGNPCLEQTLESYELCCLVETFPSRHESLEDFLLTVRAAFMYAKIVTLAPTHWPTTNAIMRRNRRVGTSLSGVAQFLAARGMGALHAWCSEGYSQVQQQDRALSEKFGVPESIKTTCIKPSGTVSLLAGSTPGMHFPESRFYLRRVRLARSSNLVPALRQAGFDVEAAVGSEESTVVASFPIDAGEGVRTLDEVGLWEQLGLAAFLQRHWADNQVSCTVSFDPASEGSQLAHALDLFQYQLKGITFLPRQKQQQQNFSSDLATQTPYPQMPYEAISEARYKELMSTLDIALLQSTLLPNTTMGAEAGVPVHEVPDKFCDTAECNVI